MKIIIELSDESVQHIELTGRDAQEWAEQIISKELDRLKRRTINQWTRRLMADKSVKSIPTDPQAWASLVKSKQEQINEKATKQAD